jgi:hypothetical protein
VSDRIEPIRRDRTEVSVPPVLRVERRHERHEDDQPERRRRACPPQPSITRDDDGTPHVDVRV